MTPRTEFERYATGRRRAVNRGVGRGAGRRIITVRRDVGVVNRRAGTVGRRAWSVGRRTRPVRLRRRDKARHSSCTATRQHPDHVDIDVRLAPFAPFARASLQSPFLRLGLGHLIRRRSYLARSVRLRLGLVLTRGDASSFFRRVGDDDRLGRRSPDRKHAVAARAPRPDRSLPAPQHGAGANRAKQTTGPQQLRHVHFVARLRPDLNSDVKFVVRIELKLFSMYTNLVRRRRCRRGPGPVRDGPRSKRSYGRGHGDRRLRRSR